MEELIIRVKCPHCGWEQNTRSLKTVKCLRCGRSYSVYRKRGFSRIVGIVKGNRELLFKRYYEIYKKRR